MITLNSSVNIQLSGQYPTAIHVRVSMSFTQMYQKYKRVSVIDRYYAVKSKTNIDYDGAKL